MTLLSIDLPQKAVAQLEELVEDFNAQTGQALKLEGWLSLHLRELAIGKQLGAESQAIKGGVDSEVNRRIGARRRELIEDLDAL